MFPGIFWFPPSCFGSCSTCSGTDYSEMVSGILQPNTVPQIWGNKGVFWEWPSWHIPGKSQKARIQMEWFGRIIIRPKWFFFWNPGSTSQISLRKSIAFTIIISPGLSYKLTFLCDIFWCDHWAGAAGHFCTTFLLHSQKSHTSKRSLCRVWRSDFPVDAISSVASLKKLGMKECQICFITGYLFSDTRLDLILTCLD